MQHRLELANVKCGGCGNSIRRALAEIDGVSAVELDVASGGLSFESDAATRTAVASRSVASTSPAPMCAAAMARMPEPVPMSMTRMPGRTYFSISAAHMPVVSWAPVPKARPGSISMTLSPG